MKHGRKFHCRDTAFRSMPLDGLESETCHGRQRCRRRAGRRAGGRPPAAGAADHRREGGGNAGRGCRLCRVSSQAEASSQAKASVSPPPAARSRTPWFPVLAAGTLGAGLAVLAGGAAWIYLAPLDDRGTDVLSARLVAPRIAGPNRRTARAQIAAATVPDMGKVDAAKIDELAARLAKLETASAATAPENGRTDIGKIEELSARISRLEFAAPPPPAPDPAKADADAAAVKELAARLARVEASIAAIPPPAAPDPTLANRLAAVEAEMKPIAEHVADLDRQNADNATSVQETRERAEAVAKAMADVNRADADQDKLHQSAKAEIAGLNGRLDALETLAKAIRDQVAEAAAPKADEPLRFAVIAAGLRFALERGEPFTAELAAAKAVGIDPTHARGHRAVRGRRACRIRRSCSASSRG